MSVMLNIPMPTTCRDCPLAFKGNIYTCCQVEGYNMGQWRVQSERQPDCPLIEVEERWIPCSERYPDNADSVLVSSYGFVLKAYWQYGAWYEMPECVRIDDIDAWMPLPAPYKEADQ